MEFKIILKLFGVLILTQHSICTDVITTSSPSPFQSLLSEIKSIAMKGVTESVDVFDNITQTALSIIPSLRLNVSRAIQESSEKNLAKYEEIKTSAEEKGVDVDLCIEYFQYQETDSGVEVFDECIDDKIKVFMDDLYTSHTAYVDYLLSIVYKIERDAMSCKEGDNFCLDLYVSDMEEVAVVLSGQIKSKVYNFNQKITQFLQDVDLCANKVYVVNDAVDSGTVKGFEDCVKNAGTDEAKNFFYQRKNNIDDIQFVEVRIAENLEEYDDIADADYDDDYYE